MKNLFLIVFFLVTIGNSAIAQSGISNDEINHQRYWYLRSELRNRFMLQGLGTGRGQPAEIIMNKCNHLKTPDCQRGLIWGDGTIQLGWYWQVLATEYYLLKVHGENTVQTLEELYNALDAFNRLDNIAELFWVGGNHKSNGDYYDQDVQFPSNGLNHPIWDNINKEWTMNGNNQAAIENNYLNNGINTKTNQYMSRKNGNTGTLNGFFVRSDIPFEMHEEFYNLNNTLNIDFIESHTTGNFCNELNGVATHGLWDRKSQEMSKDQLMHILFGLAVIRKYVDANASFNGHNIQNMIINIGTRLYNMFRVHDNTLVNEHAWFIFHPWNLSKRYTISTYDPGPPPSITSNYDASRCIEYSTGLGAIFDWIIDGDIYIDVSNVGALQLFDHHQNLYSKYFQNIFNNYGMLLLNSNTSITYLIPDIGCIQDYFKAYLKFESPSSNGCWTTNTTTPLSSAPNSFFAMPMCLAAGGNGWSSQATPSSTSSLLWNINNTFYDANKPYYRDFSALYLLHKALYPGASPNNNWDPQNIEYQLNQMKCEGPSPQYISYTDHEHNVRDYSYPWHSINRWYTSNPTDVDINAEFSGTDYMILYNLYRLLYNTNNTDLSGNQIGYKNLLDFSISTNYPNNGYGEINNPASHYVFQSLESKSQITSPTPPINNNYSSHAGDVKFTAGWSIKLKDGFKASYGTKFRANIDHEICAGTTLNYPDLVTSTLGNSSKRGSIISPEEANNKIEYDRDSSIAAYNLLLNEYSFMNEDKDQNTQQAEIDILIRVC